MIHLGRVRLPPTAWSPAFALALVVVIVELYLLIFFMVTARDPWLDLLSHHGFRAQWYGEGALTRGLSFEFRKINLFLVGYLWLKCRAMHPRWEAVQRLSLIGAALMLLAVQHFFSRFADWAVRPEFVLIRVE